MTRIKNDTTGSSVKGGKIDNNQGSACRIGTEISRRSLLVCGFLCLVTIASAQSGAVAYISSREAQVHAQASLDSATVAVLEINDEVEIVERRKVWLQVKKDALIGWVSRYSISTAKPSPEKLSIVTRLKNFFSNENRRVRLTYVSTAGGIRNLTEDESDAAGRTDFRALRALESMILSDSEIDQFIADNVK